MAITHIPYNSAPRFLINSGRIKNEITCEDIDAKDDHMVFDIMDFLVIFIFISFCAPYKLTIMNY